MGQETLHPLVTLANLSGNKLLKDLRMPCDFYALIYRRENEDDQISVRSMLWLVKPGEIFEIPSIRHIPSHEYIGVLFHPDLLCDTPLKRSISTYPTRCRCHSTFSERERQIIVGCLSEIGKELQHAIDRHSSSIIVSYIELLLNYCTRFCSHEK